MEPVQPPGGALLPAADPPKPGDAAPSYITEEQLQTALTTRFRTFEQKIDKALTDSLGTMGTRLAHELAAAASQGRSLLRRPGPRSRRALRDRAAFAGAQEAAGLVISLLTGRGGGRPAPMTRHGAGAGARLAVAPEA